MFGLSLRWEYIPYSQRLVSTEQKNLKIKGVALVPHASESQESTLILHNMVFLKPFFCFSLVIFV